LVVPKRFARRAVTRNLVKRQMRAVMAGSAVTLDGGLWVLRLKSALDRTAFPSAASPALRRAVRAELLKLMDRAARPPEPAPAGRPPRG
jgi:ribonuclease P protein component